MRLQVRVCVIMWLLIIVPIVDSHVLGYRVPWTVVGTVESSLPWIVVGTVESCTMDCCGYCGIIITVDSCGYCGIMYHGLLWVLWNHHYCGQVLLYPCGRNQMDIVGDGWSSITMSQYSIGLCGTGSTGSRPKANRPTSTYSVISSDEENDFELPDLTNTSNKRILLTAGNVTKKMKPSDVSCVQSSCVRVPYVPYICN
jgi:hypothetical protein